MLDEFVTSFYNIRGCKLFLILFYYNIILLFSICALTSTSSEGIPCN